MKSLIRGTRELRPEYIALIIIGLWVAEIAVLSQQVDAYSLVQRGFEGWQGLFGYLGHVAKWAVVMVVSLLLLLAPTRTVWAARLAEQVQGRRVVLWLSLQLGSFLGLVVCNERIFGAGSTPTSVDFALWLGASLLVLGCSMLALMPARLWFIFGREHGTQVVLAMLIATLMVVLALSSGKLWGPLAAGTFRLAELWLGLLPLPDLYVSEAERVLGISGFYVHVADACSGYEGIGLVSAFTVLVLYLYRHTLRFPHAWLLWPLAVVVIWLLNSVRIAALIVIGAVWSPEVAVGGFHSQAGWLMFIATSLALLWFALKFPFFNRQTEPQVTVVNEPAAHGQNGFAVLIPIVALLASTLVIGTFSAGFDYAYPLKVIIVAAAIAWVWPELKWRPTVPRGLTAFFAGLAVAVLWVVMLGLKSSSNGDFQQALDELDPPLAYLWLAFRVLGASITVPIAEELAFRGYLLARLSKSENFTDGPLPRVWLALVLSAVAFGALHGAWLAGAVAGAIYGYVRWRSATINEAIWAHALTNALLCVFAIATGAWHLL